MKDWTVLLLIGAWVCAPISASEKAPLSSYVGLALPFCSDRLLVTFTSKEQLFRGTHICSVETALDLHGRIHQPLVRILNSTFFRYYKVNLNKPCLFWPSEGTCAIRQCAVSECQLVRPLFVDGISVL